jgi:hypothetical protein
MIYADSTSNNLHIRITVCTQNFARGGFKQGERAEPVLNQPAEGWP